MRVLITVQAALKDVLIPVGNGMPKTQYRRTLVIDCLLVTNPVFLSRSLATTAPSNFMPLVPVKSSGILHHVSCRPRSNVAWHDDVFHLDQFGGDAVLGQTLGR